MDLDKFSEQLMLVRAVALDLDGVVYRGSRALPGADTAIGLLRRLGSKVHFVTNNSGEKRAEVAAKLTQMGIIAAEEEVLTSGFAAAIQTNHLAGNGKCRAFVLGSEGLKSELRACGLEIVSNVPSDFVVVGLDTGLSYERLCMAFDALLSGAIFIACNLDAVFPSEGGKLFLGCGPAVAALELASGRKPDLVVGKPNTLMLEMLSEQAGVQPHEILVVGDSPESDIAMANRYGSPSALLASDLGPGSARLKRPDQEPGVVVQSLYELAQLIEDSRAVRFCHRGAAVASRAKVAGGRNGDFR